ncbi:MAG: peptidylprolyl isomerase [Clostridia bacterium]|nr:peptidylprolyl isomerase [Clostridia bacterium]
MNIKRILCLVMALVLALGVCALAEGDDLQAQLDEANAHIAELEAQVEKYRPFYERQIVAEYGDEGIVWLEDAQKQFDEASAMYAQYGIPVENYAAEIKQSIVEALVRQAVLDAKAEEMGLSELDEETKADLAEQANADLETYIGYYSSYFAKDGASDEENREATVKGLAENGISADALLEDRIENYVSEQLHDAVTKDVTVSEDEVQAKYQSMIEDDKDSYAEDDAAYNSARSGGETIAWNPEGYRAVKHVLVKFDEDQAKQYTELQSALSGLNDELAALDDPKPTAEPAEGEETGEAEEAAPRTREEIQADIGEIGTSIEALYSQLMPKAQEVVDAFNGGADFDSLIDQYGEDPGMTREPSKTQGYAVSEKSTYWDPAFTEGAMSIAEVGQISQPVRGKNGVHIIYYLSDITPGEVPYEDIREDVAAAALEDKVTQTYDDQVAVWVEEANPVYHLDRF